MTAPVVCQIVGIGRRPLAVDVYRPPDNLRRTAVLLLHGGGWRAGSRQDMEGYARALAALGFVAIAPEYRLLGEAPWPAQIEDVCDAVAWVAAQADALGIEPSRIAIQGFSAGGHLALLAAARGGVAAVIALFAPAVLDGPTRPGSPHPAEMLLGSNAMPDVIRAANPIAQIAPGFPPTLLLSGTDDPLVPPDVSLQMYQALRAANVDADLHLYHGHTHEFSALPTMLAPVQAEVALFLERAVVDPEHYRAEALALNPFARPPFARPPVGEAVHAPSPIVT